MMDESLDALVRGLPIVQQLQRLEERMLEGGRLQTLVVILTTNTVPPWAHRLTGTHAAVLIGPDEAEHGAILAKLRHDLDAILAALTADPLATPLGPSVLVVELRQAATAAAIILVTGAVREVAVLGPRGDGKTVTALVAWIIFAHCCRESGGHPPAKVLTMTGTFTEHRARLCTTLREPLWRGAWQDSDDEHTWTFTLGGQAYVMLDLVGIEDLGGLNRARNTAHGLWLEEPAAAGTEAGSAGLSVDALMIGSTSLRLPSYAHPILVTSNLGSESHWTWVRYAVDKHPGTTLVRIPPGERASAKDRAAWREALAGRPDLIRRLIDGEPALIIQGQGVLDTFFNLDLHVAEHPIDYVEGQPLILGHDGGLTPVTIVAQWNGPQLQILAALASKRAGTEQHLRDLVIPWLVTHAPQAELEHWIDPSMATPSQSDLGMSSEKVIRRLLGGRVRHGEVKIQARLDPLLAILGQLITGGRPALLISPTCHGLIEACAGRWHYERDKSGHVQRDEPEKDHPWSDYGDTLCYVVGGAKPWQRGAITGGGPDSPFPRQRSYIAKGGSNTGHLGRPRGGYLS